MDKPIDINLREILKFETGKLDSNQEIENGKYPFFTCSPDTLRINDYSFDTEAIILAGNNANGIFSVKYFRGKFNAYQRTYVITPRYPNSVDCKYMFYQIQILTQQLCEYSSGTATRFLTMQILNNLTVSLPSIDTQRSIARILGSLDDKIELNQKMNETLEAMKQLLFKSWFMDFDPVLAKAEGRNTGLPLEIAALFPNKMNGSEFGEIPAGWKIEPFRKILHHSTSRIGAEDAVEYSATITGLTLRDERFNKQLSKSREKNKKIVKGDLVFGLSREIVNFGLMKDAIGSVSPVYEIFKVDTDVYIPELLEMKIRQDMSNHIDILKSSAREGQAIDREYLLSKTILIPDMRIQKKFFDIFSTLQRKIENNEKQTSILTQIRDSLMPKLMSGEIIPKMGMP